MFPPYQGGLGGIEFPEKKMTRYLGKFQSHSRKTKRSAPKIAGKSFTIPKLTPPQSPNSGRLKDSYSPRIAGQEAAFVLNSAYH
jgi:hypothetical protein